VSSQLADLVKALGRTELEIQREASALRQNLLLQTLMNSNLEYHMNSSINAGLVETREEHRAGYRALRHLSDDLDRLGDNSNG
jgi:hypothetical protein